jgi:molybdenum cofactor cytidylyltransferase
MFLSTLLRNMGSSDCVNTLDGMVDSMDEVIAVTAAVLAAGKSSRMGKSKPLFPIGGIPMAEVTLRKLLPFPFERIVCVTGHLHEAIREMIEIEDSRFEWIYNPAYAEGQSTSLRRAADCRPDPEHGLMVFLADQPFIRTETIGKVISEVRAAAALGGKCVVQPVYCGQKGHPVYFSGAMLDLFSGLQGDIGAKTVIAHADRHLLVPVEDEGVIIDLDTLDEYEKYSKLFQN